MNSNIALGRFARIGSTVSLATILSFGAASNASAKPSSELVDNISVTGTAIDINSDTSATITGNLQLTGIEFDAGLQAFMFEGNITGVASTDGVSTQVLNQVFTTTGTLESISPNGKKCDVVIIDLSEFDLNLVGLQVDLSDVELDVDGIRGRGRWLGNQLCKLSHLTEEAAVDKIPREVDRINNVISDSLSNISVVGTLETSGTFTGFLTVDSLSVDTEGNIVINGLLSGLAVGDGLTTVVASQSISTSATVSGTASGGKGNKCSSILIDPGVIELEPEGLMIDIGEVALDVGAAKGPGGKVGKRLCKLTKTLDKPGKPEKIAKKVLKAVDKINKELLK